MKIVIVNGHISLTFEDIRLIEEIFDDHIILTNQARGTASCFSVLTDLLDHVVHNMRAGVLDSLYKIINHERYENYCYSNLFSFI